MLRKFVLFLVLSYATGVHAQTVSKTIDPLDCKLFTALLGSADHKSTDATALGKPIDIGKMNKISLSLAWTSLTGSVDATFRFQVATVPLPVEADWTDKTGASMTLSGATSTNSISVSNLTERWGRVVYVANSVTGGTITGYCNAKSI